MADRLSELYEAKIFVFGGPGEEHLADRIEKAMKHPVTNLAGKLSLNELVYLMELTRPFCDKNVTGPMHIAAAVKTPVVALFGPEDPSLHKALHHTRLIQNRAEGTELSSLY